MRFRRSIHTALVLALLGAMALVLGVGMVPAAADTSDEAAESELALTGTSDLFPLAMIGAGAVIVGGTLLFLRRLEERERVA